MKRFIVSAFTLFVFIIVAASLPIHVSAADTDMDIRVYIDGEEIEFDVKPAVINQRTMVPMRFIFEYFGVEVEWDPEDQGITAYLSSDSFLYMQLNYKLLQIIDFNDDNTKIMLDVAPIAINGRTLVPLRAIAEVFNATVEWEQETKSVIITTLYPKSLDQTFNDNDLKILDILNTTTANEYNYISGINSSISNIDLSIENNILYIKGNADEEYTQYNIEIGYHDINNGWTSEYLFQSPLELNSTINCIYDLSLNNVRNYQLVISAAKISNSGLVSSIKSIDIYVSGTTYIFPKKLVLNNNYKFISKWVSPSIFLKSINNQEIVELSNMICQGAVDDYEKVMQIHDWVCENIYYDYDYYEGRTEETEFSAIDVLHSKKTVCSGYSNLMQALIQAQNIPCRVISGYALGASTNVVWTDENVSKTTTNHAWNQAYVNNRWITLDATWDSGNKYRNGEYICGDMRHTYFDISLANISMDHKFIK